MTAEGINRRDMMKVSVLGAAVLTLPMERVVRAKAASDIDEERLPRPYSVPFERPPVAQPVHRDAATRTDYYEITMEEVVREIIPGVQTPVFAYNGTVPGPTIHVERGRTVVVRQINKLPDVHPTEGYIPWTSVHLHGNASLPQYDGYASDITRPGQLKDYHYPNMQAARTLWYHDHGVGHTSENVYMGLAAMYITHDPLEDALELPSGDYDVPLIISDVAFDRDGQLLYDDNDDSEAFGDVILVNGRPWPVMQVERRKYRFRILDACVSRGFRLRLSSNQDMTVIGTDGGLMPAPQTVRELRIGMAERYEVVIDFAENDVGDVIDLRNLGVENSVDFDDTDEIMRFEVVDGITDPSNNRVPAVLNPNNPIMLLTEDMATRRRHFRVKKNDEDLWSVDEMTWADVIESDFQQVLANPGPGDVEIWSFENTSGGWFHPMHIHLIDFKILSRNGRPPRPEELGPKDVVYVGEGETVRLLMRFEPHEGRYMIHCHNAVHEDHDMMVQFRVGEDTPDNDPFGVPPVDIADAPPFPPVPEDPGEEDPGGGTTTETTPPGTTTPGTTTPTTSSTAPTTTTTTTSTTTSATTTSPTSATTTTTTSPTPTPTTTTPPPVTTEPVLDLGSFVRRLFSWSWWR